MLNQQIDPTKGSIFKKLSLLAVPMIISNVLQNLFNIVDMIFVGRLGADAIAAVSYVGILTNLTWTVLIGLAIAANATISRYVGARDLDSAKKSSVQCLFLGLLTSVILFFFGLYGAQFSIGLLGAEENVTGLATPYFKYVIGGSGTLIFLFLPSAIMRGSGDSFKPMLIMSVSTIINIVLDPLLIFGLLGFPRLEVTGAAIATITGQGVGAVLGMFVLFSGYTKIRLKLSDFKFDYKIIKKLINIAVPGSGQGAMRSITALVFIRIVSEYGVFAVAAYGIGLRLILAALLPGFAIAGASSVMVGQNLGAKRPERSEKSAWIGVFSYAGLLVIPAVIAFINAPFVMKIFNSDPEVVRIGSSFMKIIILSFPFIAASLVLGSSLNGAGDTISPMIIIGITTVGTQLLLAMFLPVIIDVKTDGLWWAITISAFLQGSLMSLRFKQGKWKLKKI